MPRFFLTILIVVGVYYGMKYLFRFLFPVLMKRWMNKMTGGGQNPFFREPEPQKKEGEVSITQKPKSEKKHPNQDRGDYVDFEEVD